MGHGFGPPAGTRRVVDEIVLRTFTAGATAEEHLSLVVAGRPA